MQAKSSRRSYPPPLSLILVGWLFVAVGVGGVLKDLIPMAASYAGGGLPASDETPLALGLIWAVRLTGALGGLLVLRGVDWARWLLVGWMGFHVGLSLMHSAVEVLAHLVIFIAIGWVLFRPAASAYFRRSVDPAQGAQ